MMGFRVTVVLGVLVALAGCVTNSKARLLSVERAGIDVVKTESDSVFEDSNIKILWIMGFNRFNFELENKTKSTLKLVWDSVSYVNENGQNFRILHGGSRPIFSEMSQAPAIVSAGGKLIDFIFPMDALTVESFPIIKAELFNKESFGKSVRILMPLEIEGTVHEYTFVFEALDPRAK